MKKKKCNEGTLGVFKDTNEAKEYTVNYTNKSKTLEQINSSMNFYKGMLEEAHSEESKKIWQDELNKLEDWKNSDDFKAGRYPQGIDELILELIEWRAVIYAFQQVNTERDPFKESGFFAQWYIGAVYGIFTIVGKLVSCDSRDKSLRKLWANISPIILSDGACTEAEVKFINEQIDYDSGRFTNNRSKVICFRNTLIAHNEAHPIVSWDDVDIEMSLLIRMWSLLVAWSSLGLFSPFRTSEQAFLGLESFFQPSEIEALKKERELFLEKVKTWSSCYAHSGENDIGRGAFSTLTVTVKEIGTN
jgi:hypothetical protein